VGYKAQLLLQGIRYLLFCKDSKWSKSDDPGPFFAQLLKDNNKDSAKRLSTFSTTTIPTTTTTITAPVSNTTLMERKTIYFVRHGESTWNDTFNRGKHRSNFKFVIGFLPGLLKALLYEFYLLLIGRMDR
jgi:hypothetical protein